MDNEQSRRLSGWTQIMDDATYYELLGVAEDANIRDIKDAYYRFANSFHPDAHPGVEKPIEEQLARLFQRGTEAYRVLVNPPLRTRYDMGLQRGELRLDTALLSDRPERTTTEGKPLHELCRSAGAKLAAKAADRLLAAGDLRGAKTELEAALRFDGEANLDLADRLEALETALYACGD